MEAVTEDTPAMENKKKAAKAEGKRRMRKGKGEKCNNEEMFSMLEAKLSLSKEELSDNYDQFMKTCPNGEMTKAQFLKDQEGLMAESLFRVFDEDGSGSMDFTEYMLASNCTSLTKPEEKLTWIFNVFVLYYHGQDINIQLFSVLITQTF